MIATLADGQSVLLMSVYKPILFWLTLTGWAYLASFLDKDAEYFYLPRRMWNTILFGAAVAAFGLWLIIPYFWLGYFLALMILVGSVAGYGYYHNLKVPAQNRWVPSLDIFSRKIGQIQQASAQRRAVIRLLGTDGAVREVPALDAAKAEAHNTVESLFSFALPLKADRVEILAQAQQTEIFAWVDGVKYAQPKLDARQGLTLIDYLREQAEMDLTERRRKQKGKMQVDAGELGRHRLDLFFEGSTRGLHLLVGIDERARTILPLNKLGLLDSQRQQLETVISQPTRLVLVACPPHHGLTTTLYSLVNRHDPYTQSIMTYQAQVREELEGVAHEQIEPGASPEAVLKRLRAILRQDPAVLMLSHLADPSHAQVVANAAQQTRIYLGMRLEETFSALKYWIKAVGDLKVGSSAVAAVVSQRLVRRLCPTCRVAYQPDPKVLKKLNLSPERVPQLYKQSGKILVKNKPQNCPDCLGMGFRGRFGVFETMVLDDEARQLLGSGQLDQFRAYLRRQKMLWLQEAGLAKVVEGQTSLSELNAAIIAQSGDRTEALKA